MITPNFQCRLVHSNGKEMMNGKPAYRWEIGYDNSVAGTVEQGGMIAFWFADDSEQGMQLAFARAWQLFKQHQPRLRREGSPRGGLLLPASIQ